VRATIDSSDRSGIRRATASASRSAACGVPALRRRLRAGTPSSPITRSALSSYPASSAPAASRWACRRRSVNPAAVAGSPAPAQNPSSSGSHSSQDSRFARQSAYSPAPVIAMSPVRSSSAR
jgi:hypothetical protein